MATRNNNFKRLTLYGRAAEIQEKLPKAFSAHILNSIISRSLTNGSFVQEASLYFSSEELSALLDDLHVFVQPQVKSQPSAPKTIRKEKKEKVSPLFEGFS